MREEVGEMLQLMRDIIDQAASSSFRVFKESALSDASELTGGRDM